MQSIAGFILLLRVLFTGEIKTKSDQRLVWMGYSGGGLIALGVLLTNIDPELLSIPDGAVEAIVILGLTLAFLSFFMLMAVVAGRSNGRTTLAGQAKYTFGRVFLYVFLPCMVVTAILFLIAFIAGAPLFDEWKG